MNLLAPRIQSTVDNHLDALATTPRPADLIQTVALPLPSLVISELLGVPFTDRELYNRLTRELLSLDRTREQLLAGKVAMKAYLLSLLHAKRATPADDLLEGLVRAQAAGAQLTDDEIAALGQLILIAGHETTANVIGLAVAILLRPPRLWDTLREQPALVDGFVEEVLRYATILQFRLLRVAREPLAIGGQHIATGDRVVLHLPAANRDPARFAEPEQFNPPTPRRRQAPQLRTRPAPLPGRPPRPHRAASPPHRHAAPISRSAAGRTARGDPHLPAASRVRGRRASGGVHRVDRPDRMFAFDEFGPLGIRPTAGSCRAEKNHPDSLPVTYRRTQDVSYFHGCYPLGDDQMRGVNRLARASTTPGQLCDRCEPPARMASPST